MRWLLSVLGVMVAGVALAQTDNPCQVGDGILQPSFPLTRVAAAIVAKKLDIIVVGTSSSALTGFGGTGKTYPARFQADLKKMLPDVAVRVTTYARPRQTAPDMVKAIEQGIARDKPALVVWQSGTADAIRGIDPDEFSAALDEGVASAVAGNADVILMNMQYSPRTEAMIALTPYLEVMRFVALQHEIDLFDRYAVMKYWSEVGTFDFSVATKKTDLAERVHACIGELLTSFVLESAKLTPSTQENAQ
ncbi:MAG: SGNH/GDSL hydrolase family protein [Xanthobacteraceae bacterium]